MPVNENKLLFNSNWELDQILKAETITKVLTAGDWDTKQEILDFTSLGLDYRPIVYLTWRRQGQTRWNLQGASSGMTDSTYTSPPFPRWSNTKLWLYGITSGVTLEIRYIIYKNKALTWE